VGWGLPGIGRSADDKETRLEQVGLRLEAVVVNQACFGIDLVRKRLEVDGRSRDLAFGSVSTVRHCGAPFISAVQGQSLCGPRTVAT
jgi:hypothetical protein